MNTTCGEWIVVPEETQAVEGQYLHRVMAIQGDRNVLVALVPNMADAALLSISKRLLDTVIAITEMLNTSKGVIDLVKLNEMVSMDLEKLAAESGEW